MRHRRNIRPGISYIVTPDPTDRDNHESWHIIIEGGHFNKLVGKYNNIQILDKGKTINYTFNTKWYPDDLDMRGHWSKRFDDLVRDILIDWLKYAHKEGMMKYAPRDTVMRDNEEYTIK